MTQQVERMLPLYEAKMIHQFDHQWATYDGKVARDCTLDEKQDPEFSPLPRYWVREEVVLDRFGGCQAPDTLLGWRDICRSTDERTMISSQFPFAAVGHTMPLAVTTENPWLLQSVWTSFVFDYVARQKVGGTHMTYSYLNQLTTFSPAATPPWVGAHGSWIEDRARYLHTPESWAADRARVRAELDACFFLIFGVARTDVDYIMETFPIVKRKDIAAYGSFRTKELILEVFDAMQSAVESGQPYVSSLEVSSALASVAERREGRGRD